MQPCVAPACARAGAGVAATIMMIMVVGDRGIAIAAMMLLIDPCHHCQAASMIVAKKSL